MAIQADKIVHYMAFSIFCFMFYGYTKDYKFTVATGIILAVLKELVDFKVKGVFSWADLLFSFIGITAYMLGVGVEYLQELF